MRARRARGVSTFPVILAVVLGEASVIRQASRVTHQPEPMCHASGGTKHPSSGDDRIRTGDPLVANQVLYH